ncbi:MAG: Holliday junction DNA helicase RuvB [Parcubacteria group bacterium CG1_02_37_13]|nr:MAG: Holliday junction DNA helicase RuvB [Parcubacteria group bacterium CG1_02_37_13]
MKNNSSAPEDILDVTLRPLSWDDYIGQDKIKENILIMLQAAKQRKEAPEHLLLYGNPGLGKTTLAYLIAQEVSSEIKVVAGPGIERPGDLVAILTNLEEGSVLFIDEIHRLSRPTEESLYTAMEDFKLNLILGKGPMARTMTLDLPRFTLIGATTKLASVSSPLRTRFGAILGLNFYEEEDIKKILQRSSTLLKISTNEDALNVLSKRSRFTPRVANHLLKRARDYAQIKGEGVLTEYLAKEALLALEIDEFGLTSHDLRILEAMIDKFNGGPVGLQAIAAIIAEEESTILEVYEPYLMRLGFIERTPRGRVATSLAFQHLKKKIPTILNEKQLFNL